MSCGDEVPILETKFTQGDLEPPIIVRWNEVVTTETSELIIDRPEPDASITVSGALVDASTGTYQYAWNAGDLVAGEGQLVKARLETSGGRRKSSAYFKINVDEDIT
jgi:hypothetical protein